MREPAAAPATETRGDAPPTTVVFGATMFWRACVGVRVPRRATARALTKPTSAADETRMHKVRWVAISTFGSLEDSVASFPGTRTFVRWFVMSGRWMQADRLPRQPNRRSPRLTHTHTRARVSSFAFAPPPTPPVIALLPGKSLLTHTHAILRLMLRVGDFPGSPRCVETACPASDSATVHIGRFLALGAMNIANVAFSRLFKPQCGVKIGPVLKRVQPSALRHPEWSWALFTICHSVSPTPF
jgi:hypothetical protein